MNTSNSRRFWELIGGLFFLIMGLGTLGGETPFGLMFMALGGALLWRLYQSNSNFDIGSILNSRRSPPVEDDGWYEEEIDEMPSQSTEKIYAHALRAAERAGLNPDQMQVLPVDIGLMVYKDDDQRDIYRTPAIPDDIDYVQPFVELRVPTRAVGVIKFEIIDADGQVLFSHETKSELQRGRNLISPTYRLPIHDGHAMHTAWQLKVSADGMPLAVHRFEWQESATKAVRRQMREDGEISNELRATLEDNTPQRLSLDDLLSYQDDQAASSQKK